MLTAADIFRNTTGAEQSYRIKPLIEFCIIETQAEAGDQASLHHRSQDKNICKDGESGQQDEDKNVFFRFYTMCHHLQVGQELF